MYQQINNPISNQKISVNSKLSKNIIKKYILNVDSTDFMIDGEELFNKTISKSIFCKNTIHSENQYNNFRSKRMASIIKKDEKQIFTEQLKEYFRIRRTGIEFIDEIIESTILLIHDREINQYNIKELLNLMTIHRENIISVKDMIEKHITMIIDSLIPYQIKDSDYIKRNIKDKILENFSIFFFNPNQFLDTNLTSASEAEFYFGNTNNVSYEYINYEENPDEEEFDISTSKFKFNKELYNIFTENIDLNIENPINDYYKNVIFNSEKFSLIPEYEKKEIYINQIYQELNYYHEIIELFLLIIQQTVGYFNLAYERFNIIKSEM